MPQQGKAYSRDCMNGFLPHRMVARGSAANERTASSLPAGNDRVFPTPTFVEVILPKSRRCRGRPHLGYRCA
jgi:hypothetical protein